jgi:hypothetical protein
VGVLLEILDYIYAVVFSASENTCIDVSIDNKISHSLSKKRERQKKRAKLAAETNAASALFPPVLYEDKGDLSNPQHGKQALSQAGWSREQWDEDWGKDSKPSLSVWFLHRSPIYFEDLTPEHAQLDHKQDEHTKDHGPPFHVPPPIPNVRRLEGFVGDLKKPVLEGFFHSLYNMRIISYVFLRH